MMTLLLTLLAKAKAAPRDAALVGAVLLMALLLGWQLAHPEPQPAGTLTRRERQQAGRTIQASQAALARDTTQAKAAEAAGRVRLDTAKAHAHRAILYHQKTAAPRHAKKATPRPAATRPADELQRQLSDYLSGH